MTVRRAGPGTRCSARICLRCGGRAGELTRHPQSIVPIWNPIREAPVLGKQSVIAEHAREAMAYAAKAGLASALLYRGRNEIR